jgi:adenylosuccinate lyase
MNHFSAKLPISRLQRDLSDSTVLRNQGLAFGYTILGYKSLLKGLNKL